MGENRLYRLFKGKKICVVALDHGLSYGRINGLENPLELVKIIEDVGCENILLNKGLAFEMIRKDIFTKANLLVNLSAGINREEIKMSKIIATSIDTAIRLDAVAVALQVNFDEKLSNTMLKEIGNVIDYAYIWRIPVMAMAYIDKKCKIEIYDAIRVLYELGVDCVKIAYPQCDVDEIVKYSTIPVLLAGGEYCNDKDYLKKMEAALIKGFGGVVIGRNIFQSEKPGKKLKEINEIVNQINFQDKIRRGNI